jgi:peptide chain release factor 3
MGKSFRGVYNLYTDEISFFDPQAEKGTSEIIKGLDNPRLDEVIGTQADDLRIDVELVRGASNEFDEERYLNGKQTPVFFGSAINNFGVQSLLDAVVELSPGPLPRKTATREVLADEAKFSGFIFKIQANMDPKHRDRIAFLRICSGKFERGMKVKQVATNKQMTVNNAITFMAQDRTIMDEAYSGDIIGIPNHGTIKVGDTFSAGEAIKFTGLPYFAPEFFRRARIKNPMKMKQLQIGLKQLAEEGAAQLFKPLLSNDLILGAVGMLQFDVVKHRLEHEYGVDMIFEPYDCYTARWLSGSDDDIKAISDKYGFNVGIDGAEEVVYLAPNRVNLQMAEERYPDIAFLQTREIT